MTHLLLIGKANSAKTNAKFFPQDDVLKLLKLFLESDPITGKLVWKTRHEVFFPTTHQCNAWNGRFAGREALTSENNGYRRGTILGTYYYAHRVIWAMHNGEWPEQIDHINGDREDNRLVNLRSVTQTINARNVPARKNNTSGFTGVHWCTQLQKWQAYIGSNPRSQLGNFDTKPDAITARKSAEKKQGYLYQGKDQ